MPRSLHAKRKLFISHSSRDRRFVARIARLLEQHKISYWYSATHIGAAKQWHDEIGRALAQCDWFLVVLTPDAVRSEWVKRELVFALNEGRYRKRIVPLLHKPCKYSRLSWTLPGFEIVDFTANFESGCRQLLRVWNLEYKPKRMTARPKSKRK
jgi:TIR domain